METEKGMTEKEFNAELNRFEEELLAKVAQMQNGKKNWLWNNLWTIISTIVLLGTMFVAWGRLTTIVEHQQAEDVRLWAEDRRIAELMRTHHEDIDRHTDKDFKARVEEQLQDIRNLIIQHMAKGNGGKQ